MDLDDIDKHAINRSWKKNISRNNLNSNKCLFMVKVGAAGEIS